MTCPQGHPLQVLVPGRAVCLHLRHRGLRYFDVPVPEKR